MTDTLIDLSKIRTYPITERKNLVMTDMFARTLSNRSFEDFIDSLPDILAARNLKQIASDILQAKEKEKPVILSIGGHVVKCGLSPLIIDLMEKRLITAISSNGAAAIHDFEIGTFGETSEDVGKGILDGTFGFAEETGRLINESINKGALKNIGIGESLGSKLLEMNVSFNNYSILANAKRMEIPYTVHVAIGTDIIHQHPLADGAAIGQGSHIDFLKFSHVVSQLGNGGVFLNFGSAVIMPEVFLKAISIARNLGHQVDNFTTANFDFIQHYRPTQNIVKRPLDNASKGYSITGHHELMLPLLYRILLENME